MSPDFDAPSDTRLTFTDARLKAIEPPKKGHVDYIDEGQPGLICRITATGKRIFHVYKWHKTDGPVRRRIGRLGVFSVSEARKEAREIVRLHVRNLPAKSRVATNLG